jgi:hypothetical protein
VSDTTATAAPVVPDLAAWKDEILTFLEAHAADVTHVMFLNGDPAAGVENHMPILKELLEAR